jgi:hypothetical protein
MSVSTALGHIGILFGLLGVIGALGMSSATAVGALAFWGVGAVFAFGGLYEASRERPRA